LSGILQHDIHRCGVLRFGPRPACFENLYVWRCVRTQAQLIQQRIFLLRPAICGIGAVPLGSECRGNIDFCGCDAILIEIIRSPELNVGHNETIPSIVI
jgi:hypothetical protein